MTLSAEQKATYARDGFLAGLPVFAPDQVAQIRHQIEALERDHPEENGQPISQYFRVNGQLVIPLLAELARTPAILDAVEQIPGRNLLVWSVELFIKEPGTQSVVSWHQDITYWGMGETDEELTA